MLLLGFKTYLKAYNILDVPTYKQQRVLALLEAKC